jgi:hypothetical protein
MASIYLAFSVFLATPALIPIVEPFLTHEAPDQSDDEKPDWIIFEIDNKKD